MDARWLRPLGVGEVIDAAFKIYRARFGALLRAVAVVVVPVQLINVIVVLSLPSTTTRTTTTSNGFSTTSGTTSNSGAVIAAFLVLQVVSILSVFLAQAVCLKIVTDAYLGTVTSWRESLRFGVSKFRSLLWISVLVILGGGIGALLCVVPGIWLYVSWCVAIPVLLVEGVKGTKAMRRSFNLVRHRWWPTFGTLIIAGLITLAVSFALTIFTVPLLLAGASNTTTQVANAIARGITSVLTTPITAAVTALIYFDLRVRKEGFDVALMAQRIGVEPPLGGFQPAPSHWATPPPPAWGAPGQQWAPPPATGWSPPPGTALPPPPGLRPPPPGVGPPPAPAPPTTPPTAPWNTPPPAAPSPPDEAAPPPPSPPAPPPDERPDEPPADPAPHP